MDCYNLDFIIQNTNGKYVIATNNGTSEWLEKKGFKMDLIVLEFSAERFGWQNKEIQYDIVNLPSPWADGYCLASPLGSASWAFIFFFIFFFFPFYLLKITQTAIDSVFGSRLTSGHMISIVVWNQQITLADSKVLLESLGTPAQLTALVGTLQSTGTAPISGKSSHPDISEECSILCCGRLLAPEVSKPLTRLRVSFLLR